METMMSYSSVLAASFVVFIFITVGVSVLFWAIVPFSVFGVKGLMKRMLSEQERTNALLTALLDKRPPAAGPPSLEDFDEDREQTH